MGINEFMQLLPARQRRSLARGLTGQEKKLLNELRKKDTIKTHCREMIILPEMVGKTLLVHNGKAFNAVTVSPEMVGHVIGEFSLTRGRVSHSAPGVGATRSSASVSVR